MSLDACAWCAQGEMKRFALREQAGADPQTYALGLKEVWEVRTRRASAALAAGLGFERAQGL